MLGTFVKMQAALEDRVIEPTETRDMIVSAVSGLITAAVMAFMMVAFYKVVGGNPGNPGNPGNSETSDIIARAGMRKHEYRWYPDPEEPARPRVHPYTRTKEIGSYVIRMTRTDGTCMIRLYEFLEGWKKKLIATWSGWEKTECDRKFEEVTEIIRQVRFEHKTQMLR